MSSLFKNKQVIHIGIEIIIVAGITFYFYRQIQSFQEQIKTLENVINDLKEINNDQEKTITKLIYKIDKLNKPTTANKLTTTKFHTISKPLTIKRKNIPVKIEPKVEEIFSDIDEYDNEQTEEVNLDDEITDELKELVD